MLTINPYPDSDSELLLNPITMPSYSNVTDHTDSPEVDDKKIDYLTIMYDKLIPLVIAAIQELSEKIDKLENMLNTQQ
ncbi:hypothetical protein [Arthrospira platensis]|uniref:hypothetical protein n=1 Tax=Limnospira platensis TaxID=118562 RepID=UPI002570666D|nr:hypothetical protein [Arthrospira platensis]